MSTAQVVALLALSLLALPACQLDPTPYEPDAGPDIAGESAGATVTPAGTMNSGGADAAGSEPTAGEVAGEPAGEAAGEPAGEVAGEPAGEVAGEPAGEAAGEPAGEAAGESAGEAAGEPAGEVPPPERCTVELTVTLPSNTPSEDEVYMASELFEPEWDPMSPEGALTRDEAIASGSVSLPNFTNVPYKFTRGSWDLVEVNADCSDRANRFIFVSCGADETLTLEAEVTAWRGRGGDCQ